ncbi:MAG: hypothetical protein OXP71_05160 [Candidatus Poribacteria bacterium]|nr:hypothetical protein [Candidatus Poribacteria bacterium]
MFHEMRDIVSENPHLPKSHRFYDYLFDSYISHVIMGIRRHIKYRDNRIISFARVLKEIVDNPHPEMLSRSALRPSSGGPTSPQRKPTGMDDFAKFADPSGTYVCQQKVKKDLDELKATAKACEAVADKRIAHREKGPPSIIPIATWEELEREIGKSLDVLEEKCVKYYELFFNVGAATMIPTAQGEWGEWKTIFSISWMPPTNNR